MGRERGDCNSTGASFTEGSSWSANIPASEGGAKVDSSTEQAGTYIESQIKTRPRIEDFEESAFNST